MRGSNFVALRSLGSAALGLSWLVASSPVAASGKDAKVAEIVSIRAFEAAKQTFVDIRMKGDATPVLTGTGKQWTLTLPNALPAPALPTSIHTGGLVSRIGLVLANAPERGSRISLNLATVAMGRLQDRPDSQTLRIALSTEAGTSELPAVKATAPGVYDLNAYQAELGMLLNNLAQDAGMGVVLLGANHPKITVNLRQVSFVEAVELLAKTAGLVCKKEKDTLLVGAAKELEPAAPVVPEPKPQPPTRKYEVYRCRHIVAQDLAKSLEAIFDKERMKVVIGAGYISPRLDNASVGSVIGTQSNVTNGAAVTSEPGQNAREIVLFGEEALVDEAIAIAQKLDRRRAQVRINVKITDIGNEALKELGVRWNWSNFTAREIPNVQPGAGGGAVGGGAGGAQNPLVGGISFGSFGHDPTFIEAALSALEKDDRAKLLAQPTISMLDGERGFILIGDRLVFPVLIGFTQANTPIFNKTEERVGIYMQVAAQIAENGEITLTIYPQVSVVTNFLIVNGASYPQISTREQQTTIRVKDGEKIVVGGLIREEEINNVQRVPLLSRIPLFGELFTYRKKTRRKSEVVILLTPEIIKD